MQLPHLDLLPAPADKEIDRLSLVPRPINEVQSLEPPGLFFRTARRRSLRAEEWYFQCAFFGLETLNECIEVDPHRRGGVPVLKGTRFTVSEALAEIAETEAVAQVAEDLELDEDALRNMLNGLSLYFNRPYEP